MDFVLFEKNAYHEMLEFPPQKSGLTDALRAMHYRLVYGTKRDADHFSWGNALIAKGFFDLYHTTNCMKYRDYVKEYCDKMILAKKIRTIDDVVNGYLTEMLLQEEDNERYSDFSKKCVEYLEKAQRNEIGSYCYRPPSQDIMVDSLVMTCPFLFAYSKRTDSTWASRLAEKQIDNYWECGFSWELGLPYHGFNYKENIKKGILGWGRAVGWFLVAIVESLDYTNKEKQVEYTKIVGNIVNDVLPKYMTPEGAFKWQLQAVEGPSDSSASAMIGYSIAKFNKLCNISSSNTVKLVQDISKNIISNIVDGKDTQCSGESGGFGLYSQKYATFPWGTGAILSLLSVVYDDCNLEIEGIRGRDINEDK